MDTNIIYEEMRRLDQMSGLDTSHIPVRISSKMTRAWGRCCYSCERKRYRITELVFAERLLAHGTREHILNVIRHEYAHAYVMLTHNKKHGHDAVWKRAALRFGCNAKRCENFDEVERIYRYKVICQNCGATACYQRKCAVVTELETTPDTTRFYCKKCRCRSFRLEKANDL